MSSVRPSGVKRRSSKRNYFWIGALVVLLVGGGAGWYFLWGPGAQPRQASEPGSRQQTYTFAAVRGDLRVSTAGSGKLAAYQSVDLSFSTSGTVSELNVALGDMVQAGQVLASLGDSETLEANLAEAKLAVLQAQKALDDLQENAGLTLAQAYSDLVSAQDAYETAKRTSQRMAYARCGEDTTLRLSDTLDKARERLENISAEKASSDVYIAAKEAYQTALANYNNCAAYDSEEKDSAASELEVARAALSEAQDTYDTLKAAAGIDPNTLAMNEANLKKAQAQLAKAEDELDGITLTAPVDGKITYLAASQGAKVGTEKFITIVDTTRTALEINVNETDISRLVVGAPVIVVFDALPDQSFSGTVIQVDPEVTMSGTYMVGKGVVELDESAAKTLTALPIGLNASVTLNPQEALDALLVPTIALQKQEDGSYAVLVQGSDGRMTRQTVSVGIHDSDYTEITSGLSEGQLVSTGSVQFVAAGSTTSSDSLKNAQDAGGFPGGAGGPPPGGMP